MARSTTKATHASPVHKAVWRYDRKEDTVWRGLYANNEETRQQPGVQAD